MRTLANCAAAVALIIPSSGPAQSRVPTSATYISAQDVSTVLATPGIDHTIRVVDIGSENFAIGVIHRGSTNAPARGRGTGRSNRSAAPAAACGDRESDLPNDAVPGAITHDSQTEGYYILSGGGALLTGGRIVNGTVSASDSPVTTELNGPSCSGAIAGPGVVKRMVSAGDIIIIPAGVPHGWMEITDHVDYLSFRPSDHVLEAGYEHPSLKRN